MPTQYQPWELAAKKMVADACLDEYRKANAGKKRHVPYRVPEWCTSMLAAVETGDENLIKANMHAARAGCYTLVCASA